MRFLPISALLLAVTAFGPCTTASRADQRTSPSESMLTSAGKQRATLRTTNGQLYTLTGDLHGFKPRDRVCVLPDDADMTHCLQGTTAYVD